MTVVISSRAWPSCSGGPSWCQHRRRWATGGDLWGIFRAAHYVGWGFFGGVYDPTTGVNSLPGIEILLAPVAMISGHIGSHRVVSAVLPGPSHGRAASQPTELLLASTVVFAVDALAERIASAGGANLSVHRRRHRWRGRRRPSGVMPRTAWRWPSPSTPSVAALNGKWKSCGWLVWVRSCDPAAGGHDGPARCGARTSRPASGDVVRASADLSGAGRRGVCQRRGATPTGPWCKQPTPPSINHPTPWVSLAPRVPNLITWFCRGRFAHVRGQQFVATHGRTSVMPRAETLGLGGCRAGQSRWCWRCSSASTSGGGLNRSLRLVWLARRLLGHAMLLRGRDDPLLPGPAPDPGSCHRFAPGTRRFLRLMRHRIGDHRLRVSLSQSLGVVAACRGRHDACWLVPDGDHPDARSRR